MRRAKRKTPDSFAPTADGVSRAEKSKAKREVSDSAKQNYRAFPAPKKIRRQRKHTRPLLVKRAAQRVRIPNDDLRTSPSEAANTMRKFTRFAAKEKATARPARQRVNPRTSGACPKRRYPKKPKFWRETRAVRCAVCTTRCRGLLPHTPPRRRAPACPPNRGRVLRGTPA